MKKVKFPIVIDDATGAHVYPDDMSLFSGVDIHNGEMIGLYAGELALEEVIDAPAANPILSISSDKNLVQLGESFNLTVKIADGETIVPVTETYYIPVVRDADQKQIDLLTANIVDGQCSLVLTIPEKGIYTINLANIKPAPAAGLSDNLELLVV